ncbi:MAG: hypothetical protein M1831_000857 [Alyxoria varia]|nr:MAG: hypothetical protein M1831_000857 [Alyxoria varia]
MAAPAAHVRWSHHLLKRPLPAQTPMTKTPPEPPPPENLPKTDRESRLAKARVVFGSRLAGPAERRRELDKDSQEIAGIVVPPRPTEPDNCCMSGCVNCVWDRYREELEEWAGKVGEVRAKVEKSKSGIPKGLETLLGGHTQKGKEDQPRTGMPTHVATSMDDDGGGSETNWDFTKPMGGGAPRAPTSFRSPDLFQDVPIGIREFMRTEKRLKEKRKEVAG